jgi:hypothetical protein
MARLLAGFWLLKGEADQRGDGTEAGRVRNPFGAVLRPCVNLFQSTTFIY